MAASVRPVLICDPDPTPFPAPLAEAFPALVVTNPRALQLRLRLGLGGYSAVVLNPNIEGPMGFSLVKKIRLLSPNAPIFGLVQRPEERLPEEVARKLTLAGFLDQPLFSGWLVKCREKLWRPPHAGKGPHVELLEASAADFVPVHARDVSLGEPVYFDLYRQMGEALFQRVKAKGGIFDKPSEVAGLLYVKRADHESYAKSCAQVAENLTRSSSLDLQVREVMSFGQETLRQLKATGLNEGTLQYARQFGSRMQFMAENLKHQGSELVRRHLNDNRSLDHSVSVAMVASLMAANLHLGSDRGASLLGLTALLHDLGLEELDESIRHGNPESFTAYELAQYQQHPLIGQAMVSGMRGMEPIVVQAIGQHHERNGGHGYPYQLSIGSLNILAEICGLSEEYVRLLEAKRLDPKLDLERLMDEKFFNQFSATVVAAFRSFLLK